LDDEQPVQKSWFKFFLVIANFSFVVYMIPGLWGAPLNALSGWLPPMSTQDFNIKEIVYDGAGHEKPVGLCDHASFSDRLQMVTGLNGYFDYDEALACAKSSGKPLFLDFTGHGCVNCRRIEQEVLSNSRIQKLLNDKFVVCALYIDDKIIELPEKLQIKDNKGNLISKLGIKNTYIQNTLFQENSQPCYIVVNPEDESILSGPIFYETNVDVFEEFLKKGVENK
ncbi:MAG TPA: thioredoxin family protein, partial [Paludibacteraceae bacterium]|nr:thioredoxin family protein [Paludibacteraceae bacterium]